MHAFTYAVNDYLFSFCCSNVNGEWKTVRFFVVCVGGVSVCVWLCKWKLTKRCKWIAKILKFQWRLTLYIVSLECRKLTLIHCRRFHLNKFLRYCSWSNRIQLGVIDGSGKKSDFQVKPTKTACVFSFCRVIRKLRNNGYCWNPFNVYCINVDHMQTLYIRQKNIFYST